jgi:hypothetical protein
MSCFMHHGVEHPKPTTNHRNAGQAEGGEHDSGGVKRLVEGHEVKMHDEWRKMLVERRNMFTGRC